MTINLMCVLISNLENKEKCLMTKIDLLQKIVKYKKRVKIKTDV